MMSMQYGGDRNANSFENDVNDDIQDDGNDKTANIIRIRGLPWNTTKQEICDFFDGVNISNGVNGIHLVTLSTNSSKPLGEAYIELATNDDFDLAQSFHKKNLGTRYIEVFGATNDEFLSIMSKQKSVQDESVVRLRGLPWNATELDISDFFQGLQIKQNNGIHIPCNKNGKASGEAYVQFETVEDCEQALKRNMNKLGHRYIEIFRSSEQLLLRRIMQTNPNRNSFNRHMNNDNFQSNGNSRMHSYERNNGNNFGRVNNNNMRGRNQNTRNDFRSDRSNKSDMFMNNSGPPNNRSFGNRSFGGNSNGGNQNNDNLISNDHFEQSNQTKTGNFFEDFEIAFNELARNANLDNFDRPSTSRNFNSRQDFTANSRNDNFSISHWNNNRNNQFQSRGGNFAGPNNRFNDDNSNRNCSNQDDSPSGQHYIHMRGLPYYTDEIDIFNFFVPLKPSFCKIIINKKGMHSGEAKAYFDSYDQVRNAMSKDRMKMGSRYIELFYGGSN